MREFNDFRFRAWDGEKMHFGVTPWQWDFVISRAWHRCEKSTGPGILGSGGSTGEFLVPGIRFKNLMQYTGLRDTNSKEIYEGDIVDFFDELIGDDRSGRYKVKYMPCSFYAEQLDEQHGMELFQEGGYYEVVGNIYENPELLNNGQEVQVSDTTKMPKDQKPD